MENHVSKMPSITEAMKLNATELKKYLNESAVSRDAHYARAQLFVLCEI